MKSRWKDRTDSDSNLPLVAPNETKSSLKDAIDAINVATEKFFVRVPDQIWLLDVFQRDIAPEVGVMTGAHYNLLRDLSRLCGYPVSVDYKENGFMIFGLSSLSSQQSAIFDAVFSYYLKRSNRIPIQRSDKESHPLDGVNWTSYHGGIAVFPPSDYYSSNGSNIDGVIPYNPEDYLKKAEENGWDY